MSTMGDTYYAMQTYKVRIVTRCFYAFSTIVQRNYDYETLTLFCLLPCV